MARFEPMYEASETQEALKLLLAATHRPLLFLREKMRRRFLLEWRIRMTRIPLFFSTVKISCPHSLFPQSCANT